MHDPQLASRHEGDGGAGLGRGQQATGDGFPFGNMKELRFVAGDRYTVADITGLVRIDFMKPAKLAVLDELANLKRWHAEVSARRSAQA
jgi:hypothetical protein